MEKHPSPSGDLNELEKRLSEWRPSTTGLDADRMLFAAGRASVRPGWGRIAWPIVSACLALAAAALGAGLGQERAARLELAARLHNQRPAVEPATSSAPEADEVPSAEPPAPTSYLAARRALAGNPDAWLVMEKADPPEEPPPPSRPIWKANSRGDLLEP